MPRIRAANIAEHKRLTRRQVLDAAQRLFQSHGYDATSLGDVAAEVGIGRTTIYEYFADKDDLLATLVEDTLPETIESAVEAIPLDAPPRERLAALAIKMVEFVATDPTLGLLLHREISKISEQAQRRVADAHKGLSAEFGAIYRQGVASGELRSLPPDLAGRFVQDLIMSAARALIESDDPVGRSAEVTAALGEVLLDGFGR